MIQLTKNGLRRNADENALRDEFASLHTVRLPRLLSVDLMAMISARMERGHWIENIHPGINRELLLEDAFLSQLLHFVTSTPDFLAVIRKLTCCDKITSFAGRIYRMPPGPGHGISWHDDLAADDGRLVGMSINLSPSGYSGGVFEIRRRDSKELLRALPNTGPADAILFRISPELKHRVTPVEGTESKTAFAGWFKSTGLDFPAAVRLHASAQSEFRPQ